MVPAGIGARRQRSHHHGLGSIPTQGSNQKKKKKIGACWASSETLFPPPRNAWGFFSRRSRAERGCEAPGRSGGSRRVSLGWRLPFLSLLFLLLLWHLSLFLFQPLFPAVIDADGIVNTLESRSHAAHLPAQSLCLGDPHRPVSVDMHVVG